MFLCPFDPLKTQVFHLTIAEEPHLCRTDDLSRTKAIWGVDSEGPPAAAICWKFWNRGFNNQFGGYWIPLVHSLRCPQKIIPYIFSSQEAEWMPGPKVMTWQQWKWWKSGEICTVTVKYDMEHHEHHEAQRPTAMIITLVYNSWVWPSSWRTNCQLTQLKFKAWCLNLAPAWLHYGSHALRSLVQERN